MQSNFRSVDWVILVLPFEPSSAQSAMKHLYFQSAGFFLCLLLAASGTAQVTFTNQNSLLQSVTGTSVADCAADMNQDGLDDVVRVFNSGIFVDYQQPNGTFQGQYYPIAVQTSPNWSICAADIDGNGWTDLCFGGGSRCSFVYFDGQSFVENQHPQYIFSQRSTFADIDNDGNLDAFVCHDVAQSHAYRNVNGILQLDISMLPTHSSGGNYAAMWVDYDNDGDQDLYITRCRGSAPVGDVQRINRLYRNDNGVFSNVAASANMNDGEQSWATVFEDFDNDGDFDAFTVNHTAVQPINGQPGGNRFMRNNGNGTFTNIISQTGIAPNQLGAWNCDAVDFDNNGFIDVFSEMSTEMWWNQGNLTFTGSDLSFNSGGIGDFNNDGFMDVIAGNNLWINNGNNNNWVKFDLEGIASNKDGIGARVEIYGSWGIQIREVRAGRSFDPASTLHVHFGLGQATSIDQVVVKWPSGVVTTISSPQINTQHIIYEAGCMNPPVSIGTSNSVNICPGETLELQAPVGVSYNWSNGATTQTTQVSQSGNYSVVVWDENGCASISNTVAVSVINPAPPVVSVVGKSVVCAGEQVVLSTAPGENLVWSNGMTGDTIEVYEGGEYTVSVNGLCNGQLISNPVSVVVLAAPAPEVTDVIIGEPGTALFVASGENIAWYNDPDGIEPVGFGNSFESEPFDSEISYWVESTYYYPGEEEQGGKLTFAGNGGLPATGGRMFFNVTETFTLEQVTVLAPATAGIRTFQLFNQEGVLLEELVIDLPTGESVVDINWVIPPGNGYQIGCAENNLFRNSSGVSFPYAIGTVGSIYNTSFGTGYYYYYYNWKIRKEGFECVSPRVEVTASVVGIEEVQSGSVSIFPNPSSDLITITLENWNGRSEFVVTDVAGRKVKNLVVSRQGEGRWVADVSALAAGVYQLSVRNDHSVVTKDFIRR